MLDTSHPAAPTSTLRISLDQLRVASPCAANWDDMEGDTVRRLCADCGLHVHNVSAMTPEQAEEFLGMVAQEAGAGRRVCVRLYKRADGTVITRNCPIGLAELKRRAWTGVRRLGAVVALCCVGVFVGRRAYAEAHAGGRSWENPVTICRGIRPFSWISERLGRQRPSASPRMVMGDVCVPVRPTLPQHVEDLVGLPRDRGAE